MRQSAHNTRPIEEALNALYRQERERILRLENTGEFDGDFENPVFGEGPLPCRVLFIGEAPGREEAASGHPFVGKAGKQLDELLKTGHIDRSGVYVTNTVKYRPVVRSVRSVRNRTPSKREITAALPSLEREIALLMPEVIVTFGNTPLSAVLTLAARDGSTVGDLHGSCVPVTVSGREMTLYPMYHPASVIYNRALIDILRQDTIRLGEKLVKSRPILFQDIGDCAIISSTKEGENTL